MTATVLPAPSEAEARAILAAKEKAAPLHRRVTVAITDDAAGFDTPHSDRDGWHRQLENAFGTKSIEFAVSQAIRLSDLYAGVSGPKGLLINALLAGVEGAAARNEVEGMLAVQLAATHEVAMDLLVKTKRAQSIEAAQAHGALATKMLRTFVTQTEALGRLKGATPASQS